MKTTRVGVCAGVVLLLGGFGLQAQESAPQATAGQSASAATATATAAGTVVPRLVQFSGAVTDSAGKPALGPVLVTFSLYALQEGGAPLWSETQMLPLDAQGHYAVFLGAASPEGLPLDLFATGSARWLGVAPALPGVGEQPRVLLVGVPYALKAADADTLEGKPASAFVQTGEGLGSQASAASGSGLASAGGARSAAGPSAKDSPAAPAAITGNGKTDFIPIWTNSTTLSSSTLFEKSGKVGIETTTPGATLEVNGTTKFDQGVTFASGQVFPGAASLGPNTFSGTQDIASGNVSIGSGNLDLPDTTAATAGVINLGGSPFLHQCCHTGSGYTNTFLGRDAGNFSATGGYNTASGYGALFLNAAGTDNTASGYVALDLNTAGSFSTATGDHALYSNSTGNNNTASGASALYANLGGSGNTAVGFSAGTDSNRLFPTSGSNSTFVGANANVTADNLTNATAIGYNAQVGESNALVLGNGAMVGIGTPTPQYALDVHGTGNFTGAVTVTGLAAGKCVQAGTGGLLTTTASACGGSSGGTITGVTAVAPISGGGTSGTVSVGLQTCPNGEILQSTGSGWVCASVGGGGTITGVTAGTDLTGGGSSGVVVLNVDTTRVPQLATANTFAATQTISSGNLALPDTNGTGTAGVLMINGNPFVHDCCLADNDNVFLGRAGNFTTTGSFNTANGVGVLYSNTTGGDNTASGYQALYSNASGSYNTAIGDGALHSITAGYGNTAIGYQALFFSTTGSGTFYPYGNTASGYQALYSNTSGAGNTATGINALYSNTSGGENTASGNYALTGNTTGSYNNALGFLAGVGSGNLMNATAIGACASVSASSALVLGTPAGQNTDCGTYPNTQVGIDVSSPSNIFTILQGGGHAIADGWDTYSSGRWKSDIQPLHGALGKVQRLRGVSYTYNANGKHDIGMIAEEVGQVVPEVVSYETNGKDAKGIDYARLTAVLVEAVKQQQAEIKHQQAQINRLKSEVRALEKK
jgi:hypothetical protein